MTTRQKHFRECFVVAEEGADREEITRTIVEMPNYFSDYNTTVHFITMEEMERDHGKMPHGGFVFRSGRTSDDNNAIVEFSLKLDSNPNLPHRCWQPSHGRFTAWPRLAAPAL